MLLLAADTSGKQGSIALAECGARESCAVIEAVSLAGGTFSAQLVPQIATLLERHSYGKGDLAGFAVVSGPGSFTGLRVGLAAVKALAEILHKPIAALSLLEAVARSGTGRGHVFSVLDAGRGELYVGDCEIGPPIRMHSERLLSREELLAEAGDRVVVTPDAGVVEALRASGIRVEHVGYPGSDVIARLGWERILRGDTIRPEDLEANYIRRSDAEIFSQPKP
jgi:tRNA threonylcarbamoyladenosine biosynthesis protein TsaB